MGEAATYTDKMSVRHILIIISGIMITFGCSALVFSTWSAFQAYVPDLLGVPTTQWALYITVLYLAEAFSAPFIGNLLAKTDIRIVLSASALLVGVGFILISLIKSMWIFYVAGLMMGLGEVGLLWLAVPTLCNKWFTRSPAPSSALAWHSPASVALSGCRSSTRSSLPVWTCGPST